MLRWWRNQIQVFLAPEQVSLVGFARGFFRDPPSEQHYAQSVACAQTDVTSQWKVPVQTLEQMLLPIAADFSHHAQLHITLSNHFVRYATIAPQPALTSPDELMVYASFQMREIYAERIDDWELSISAWDPGTGALCAAIDRDLQADLIALAQRCQIRHVQITPYLAAVLDRYAKQLVDEHIWFVLVEAGRFCLAALINGVWRSVRNQRVVANLQEELLSALIQTSITLGIEPSSQRVYLLAPEHPNLLADNHDVRWQFVHLSDESSPAAPHFLWSSAISAIADRRNHA